MFPSLEVVVFKDISGFTAQYHLSQEYFISVIPPSFFSVFTYLHPVFLNFYQAVQLMVNIFHT